jgi:hypothetical protein
MIKKLGRWLFSVVDSFGRARAAAYLSRSGQHEAARKIMTEAK